MSTPDTFFPGDMVRAVHHMRAWENDWERGDKGIWVKPGDFALVLQVWRVGRGRTRLRLLVNDRLAMFSCYTRDLPKNWLVEGRQLPTSGST